MNRSLSFILIVLFSSSGLAAFSNENSLLVGDRSAGMGGATVGLAGDTAGSPYYNPGTLAFLEGQAFSAAVGIYKKFDITYGADEDFTKAPLRVNQGFFRSLPASTANVIRWSHLPDWTLAFSVVVPDYEQYKGDLRNDGTNISTLGYTDESLWVGGSMSRKISETEGVGFTLYYTARSLTQTLNDRSFPSASVTRLYSREKTVTENALLPILGYYNQPSERWAWGMAVRLPAMQISGRASLFESYTEPDGSGAMKTTNTGFPEKSARVVIPGKATLGFSFRPTSTWLLTSDFSLREGVSYKDLEDSQYATTVNHRAMTNIALGVEKEFADWFKIRMGGYTNFSSQPDPDPDLLQFQEDHVDMLGFSANFVFVAGQKISYTFGGYYTGGRGRSMQRIDQAYTVIQKTEHVFTMLVGTSFAF